MNPVSNFDFRDNPYQPPSTTAFDLSGPPPATGKIVAPAIGLIVVAALGLACSLFNVAFAATMDPLPQAGDSPIIIEMKKSGAGTVPLVVQAVFVFVNIFIIAGGVMMARVSNWGVALAASIVAMINFGSFCCLLGLPIGIWSVVILMQPDVKAIFARR